MEAEQEFHNIFGQRENQCVAQNVPPRCSAPEPKPEYISSNITPELIKMAESSEIK